MFASTEVFVKTLVNILYNVHFIFSSDHKRYRILWFRGPIIVAPYLSDASRRICKEAGIGCVDLAGNAFLSFQPIFVEKTGIPNPFATLRVTKSLFSPKSSRVLPVLPDRKREKRGAGAGRNRPPGREYGGTGKSRRTQVVQDVRARKARGCDLAFESYVTVTIEGELPGGGVDRVSVKVTDRHDSRHHGS